MFISQGRRRRNSKRRAGSGGKKVLKHSAGRFYQRSLLYILKKEDLQLSYLIHKPNGASTLLNDIHMQRMYDVLKPVNDNSRNPEIYAKQLNGQTLPCCASLLEKLPDENKIPDLDRVTRQWFNPLSWKKVLWAREGVLPHASWSNILTVLLLFKWGGHSGQSSQTFFFFASLLFWNFLKKTFPLMLFDVICFNWDVMCIFLKKSVGDYISLSFICLTKYSMY